MGKESIRFIHAADFHLERPMQDLLDLPEHLKSLLVDAPWKAVENLFEMAVVENVDFVLLAGDLLNPVSCGAVGPASRTPFRSALTSSVPDPAPSRSTW